MNTFFKHRKTRPVKWQPLQAILLMVFVFTAVTAEAQKLAVTGVYEQAEQFFRERKYFEAAQCYKKYLATEKPAEIVSDPFALRKKERKIILAKQIARQEATYKLAESHRLTHDFTQAEKWYKEAIELPGHNPLGEYWYGITLRANQKYDEAFVTLHNFIDTYAPDDEWKENARFELRNLEFIKEQTKKNIQFAVTPELNKVNQSAYALVIPGSNSYVFTSIYVDSSEMKKGKHAYFARLYSSVKSEALIDSARLMPIEAQQGYHDGLAAFAREGKTMFFTRWTTNKQGVKLSALYRTDKTETGWTNPVKLGAPFNLPGSSTAQPFITEDNRFIIFSSNRPGGSGGYDIWYTALDSSLSSGTATNMGAAINTKADEMSPYYHQKTHQLVFASNGRVGMGGFDIYSVAGDIAEQAWQEVSNPGIPINSSKDDMYFISTDEEILWNNGWLSSDRASDCCLELFSLQRLDSQYVSGVVTDAETGKPIANASIRMNDTSKTDGSVFLALTDSNGRYYFSLARTRSIWIIAQKPGYDSASAGYIITIKTGRDSLNADTMRLKERRLYDPDVGFTGTDPPGPPKPGEVFDPDAEAKTSAKPDEVFEPPDAEKAIEVLHNRRIHFAFDEAVIERKYFSYLDSIISVMEKYPSVNIEIDGHTDAFGTSGYNDRLGRERAEACIRYLVHRGIDATRISGFSYGETIPIGVETINGEDNPDARYLNRRAELRLVQHGSTPKAGTAVVRNSQTAYETTKPAAAEPAAIKGRTGSTQTSFIPGEFIIVVHYSFDKAVINTSYYRSLDTLAQLMQASPSMKLEVNGHTDTKGSDAYNLRLADERVHSCIQYLVAKGIGRDRFTGKAHGECCPVAQETMNGKDDPEARWMNRRVEFRWLKE
jgi:outer membrane protein OmpA-like peptidoglycan-associated protein/tetratricopeptide (TPR) repeat protein